MSLGGLAVWGRWGGLFTESAWGKGMSFRSHVGSESSRQKLRCRGDRLGCFLGAGSAHSGRLHVVTRGVVEL